MKKTLLKKNLVLALTTAFLACGTSPALAFEASPEPCTTDACMDLQKDPWVATGLNLIPLGVGSFHQGDQIGGTVVAAIDAVSLATLLAPFTFLPQTTQGGGWAAGALIVYGGAGLLLGRLVGVTVPWIHYSAYEKDKANAALIGTSALEQASVNLALVNYQWDF